jgi:hypothetical protein
MARLPSPALVIAFIALLAGLSGTAIGLPGSNSVDKNDIKRGAVRTKALARNAVTGVKIKSGAVGTSDVRNDALTGTDVNEASLGKVPAATNADSADDADQLGGMSLRGLSQWVLVGTAGDVVRSSGGVTVTKLAANGRYRVTFASDVSNCAYNANAGSSSNATDATNFSNRFAMVGRSATAATDVQVELVDVAGTQQNNPFFLSVQC